MKTNLIWCTAFVLGFAAIAVSQEADTFYVTEAARNYDSFARSHFAAPPVHYDCEADCQIEWGQFRNGSLWENYCVEKHISREHLMRAESPCLADRCRPLHDLLTPRRVVPCESPSHSRRSKCQRERLLSFNLFCELFGWRDCACCAESCCDGPNCSAAAPQHSGTHDAGAGFHDSDPASEIPSAPSPHGPGATESHSHSADHHPSPINPPPPAPLPPTPEQLVPEQPVPPAVEPTAPAVPRNKLPQANPASTRKPARKVLVAERLSDYIKI